MSQDDKVKEETSESSLWTQEGFTKLLPRLFDVAENISFPFRLVCWSWYRSIWEGLYHKPVRILIRQFPETLVQTQRLISPTFSGHLQKLTKLNIDNSYVHDDDIMKVIVENPPSQLTHISMRLMQNHAELSTKGLTRIATCQHLRSLAITFIGGTHFFPQAYITPEMCQLISTFHTLKDLEVSVDVTSLPHLATMKNLDTLKLSFRVSSHAKSIDTTPLDVVQNNFKILSSQLTQLTQLTIERTSGDGWNLNGITEGFPGLQALYLRHITKPVVFDAPWTSPTLKKVVINCCPQLNLLPFSKQKLEHFSISRPIEWDKIYSFLSSCGSLLYLQIDGVTVGQEELSRIANIIDFKIAFQDQNH